MNATEKGVDSPRKRVFAILFVVGTVAIAVGAAAIVLRILDNPVKNIDVTQLQRVEIHNSMSGLAREVDPQHWSPLVNYFKSSSYAWSTAKWKDLATIRFVFKDGSEQKATVYDTGRQVGCFNIDGVYYTGGDERMLIRLMDDAFRYDKQDRNSPRQRR